MLFDATEAHDFRALVEAATDAILVIGGGGDILYANDAAGALFGRPVTSLVGADFGHPMVHGQTVELDVPLGNQTRIVEMRVSSVLWDGRRASVAILRDVSERVWLTANLRDRLRFEELLLEISAGFARATRADENTVNAEALRLLAIHVAADRACLMIQDGDTSRIVACYPPPPDEANTRPLADALMRFVADTGRLSEPMVVCRRGTVSPAALGLLDQVSMNWMGILPLSAGPERVGMVILLRRALPVADAPAADLDALRPVSTVLSDSMRRLRAESLLNDAMAKQAAVFQQAVEGLALVRNDRIVRANHAMAQILGYPPEDLEGLETRSFFASEEGYHTQNTPAPASPPQMPPGSLASRRVFVGEYLFQRRDGQRFWGELKGAEIETSHGLPEAVWVLRDITEQREEGRRKEQLIEELRRSNAELERFAFITSHDLKEPVRMVASYVNLLARRHSDSLNSEGREFLSFALEGARRIHQMIEGILDYARIEKSSSETGPVDLDAVLKRVCEDLKDTLREAGTSLSIAPLPRVRGVPSELDRLFGNLIGNAIKFAKPHERPDIQITCEREDAETWHLTVRDRGIGIPAHDRDKVFDLFWRLHTREGFEGNGLGLAIAKRIVERRGGHIWLDSRENDGTTFHILLPAASET